MTPRVLYIHGLESGPGGRKVRALRAAGFDVQAELMPCGRAQVVRDPVVVGALLIALLGMLGSALALGQHGLLLAIVLLAPMPWLGRRLLVRRVFRRSVAVQQRAIAHHRPDVLVASSFGGAVALELLASGSWTGPTVLLCPAHRLVARRAGWPDPTLPAAVSRVVVVHATADETVPIADSEALIAGSSARLVRVDDDHRLSSTATAEDLRAWVDLARG